MAVTFFSRISCNPPCTCWLRYIFFYIKPIIHHKGLLYVCMAFWECKSTVCEYFMLSIFFPSSVLDPVNPLRNKKPSIEWLKLLFQPRSMSFFNSLVCKYLHLQFVSNYNRCGLWHLALISHTCSFSVTCIISAVIVQIEYCLQKQTSSCVAAAYLVDFFLSMHTTGVFSAM